MPHELETRAAAYDRAVLAEMPENDIGNGRRFAHRFGDEFRFAPDGGWRRYRDGRWRPCAFDDVVPAAKFVVEHIKDESQALAYDLRAPRLCWAARSQSWPALERAIKCARSERPILTDEASFDSDPTLFNVANGTLVLKRDGGFSLKPHTPADLLTRQSPVFFDPSADAPTWRAHLERCQPSAEVRAYLQRVFGYCLLGQARENAYWIFCGKGGNGKTKTLGAVRYVLGEYASALDVRVLIDPHSQAGGDSASPQLAALAGDTRLALVSEPPRKARLNEGLLKLLTGDADVSVRRLHKPPFEFRPRFKIILDTNSKPTIVGDDHGIWRRTRLVDWPVRIPDAEVDTDIEDKLEAEAPGILNWMLKGLADYYRIGLAEPAEVRAAIASYHGASDDLQEWAGERLAFASLATCDQRDLLADCQAWLTARARDPVTQSELTRALRAMGIAPGGLDSRTRRVKLKGVELKRMSSQTD